MIAAKGARMTQAPAEFGLVRDVMDGWQAAGNDIGAFDHNSYIINHYETPAQRAEIDAAKPLVEAVQKSHDEIQKTLVTPKYLDQLQTYAEGESKIRKLGDNHRHWWRKRAPS